MTTTNATQMAKVLSTDATKAEARDVTGKVRVFRETVTLDSQESGDVIRVGQLPAGARFLYGVLVTDTSLGTASIALGHADDVDAFRAAAAFTATDTPTLFGHSAGYADEFAEKTDVIATVANEPLPASGKLYVELFYSVE